MGPLIALPTAARTREIRRAMLLTMISSIPIGGLYFIVPLYARSLGATNTELGILAFVYNLPYFVMPILAGWVADRIGRTPPLALGVTGYCAITILFPFLDTFEEVLAVRVLQAFFGGIYWVSLEAFLADRSPRHELAQVLALFNVSWSISFALGPFILGVVLDVGGYGATFGLASLAVVPSAVLAILLLLEERRMGPPIAQAAQAEATGPAPPQARTVFPRWVPLLTVFLCGGVLGVYSTFIGPYAREAGWSSTLIGLLFLIQGAIRVGSFFRASVLVDRGGERLMLAIGLAVFAGMGLLAVRESYPLLILGMASIGLGMGAAYTAAITLVARTPGAHRGRALGVFEVSFSAGLAAAPFLAGIAADTFGAWTPYPLMGGASLVGLALMFVGLKRRGAGRGAPTAPNP